MRISDYENLEIAQFNEMVEFVQKDYSRNITVSEIARHGGVCRTKCFSIFSKFSGLSPKEYLNNLRLEKACEILCASGKSILQVSEECGFNSQSYFTLSFSKKYGLTPFAFRQKNYSISNLDSKIAPKVLYDAISALSYDFHKILKVELNNGSYSIVKTDFPDKPESLMAQKELTSWLSEFSQSNNIFAEDRESFQKISNLFYLRSHFQDQKNRSPFKMKYRRLLNGEYKWVSMEIIPDRNYSSENQTVYLYVRDYS